VPNAEHPPHADTDEPLGSDRSTPPARPENPPVLSGVNVASREMAERHIIAKR
jgi:hypothetical protein